MKIDGDGFLEWNPLEVRSKRFDVCDISWRLEEVVFTLTEDALNGTEQKQKYELIWNSGDIISYHVSDETYRADCWGKTEEFEMMGRFYARKASSYLEKMQKMSSLFPEEAIHFTVIGINIVVDVIAKNYPSVN